MPSIISAGWPSREFIIIDDQGNKKYYELTEEEYDALVKKSHQVIPDAKEATFTLKEV